MVKHKIMPEFIVRINDVKQITHDVKRFRLDKPGGYSYIPGQATDVSLNTPAMKEEKSPFTFTSTLDKPYLEFTIKIYPEHERVTNALNKAVPGTELILDEPFGAISYKGKGVFIAGGAGITPFLAIFRDLKARNELKGNKLIFANKTRDDIILQQELRELLGENFINVLSGEKADGYETGFVTEELLRKYVNDFNQNFYICGPPPMMDAVTALLARLGADKNAITMEM